jgi:menaquinol-cytochrome c reductase iron-sulfur subunit
MEQANQAEPAEPPHRRAFLTKSCAVVVGGIVGAFPIATGLAVFLDPIRRKSGGAIDFVSVASLNSLPEDGLPVKFPVITSRVDVWTKSPLTPVGAVYLRRTGPKSVQAFNVVCPHAGCFVDFNPGRKSYLCPCHDSTFAMDGKINDPRSPSPRGLDELEVEIRNDTEVWVKFQNFRAGVHEKIPLA